MILHAFVFALYKLLGDGDGGVLGVDLLEWFGFVGLDWIGLECGDYILR